jgi:cytoskeletal protein CcmA (bactofilin family)
LPEIRPAPAGLADYVVSAGKQERLMGYFSRDKSSRTNVEGKGREANVKDAAGRNPAETVCTLGFGMSVTGTIACEGTVQIFGRVTGDIQARQVIIGEGGEVEGNIAAHDVVVSGAFKGTVRGHNVSLKDAALVDGEVFSRSLTVEKNVRFDGVSRRLEESIELPSDVQVSPLNTAPESDSKTVPAA